jgi:hypothetical protein
MKIKLTFKRPGEKNQEFVLDTKRQDLEAWAVVEDGAAMSLPSVTAFTHIADRMLDEIEAEDETEARDEELKFESEEGGN